MQLFFFLLFSCVANGNSLCLCVYVCILISVSACLLLLIILYIFIFFPFFLLFFLRYVLNLMSHVVRYSYNALGLMSCSFNYAAIPAIASDAKYFTSTSLSVLSLSSTGFTCVCTALGSK